MEQKEEDRLCGPCSKVDLYSLFTGPRHSTDLSLVTTGPRIEADIGTLRDILEDSTCPLCRLIQHDLIGRHSTGPKLWRTGKYHDLSRVQCYLRPYRADSGQDTTYMNEQTREKVATVVQVCLRGVEGCGKEEADLIKTYVHGNCGIQLLSPESVDPLRPLLNGFQATTMARSLELLSGWVKACRESHDDTCRPSLWPERPTLKSIRLIDVHSRALISEDPYSVDYVALSYVWGKHTEEYVKLADEIQHNGAGSHSLPPNAPAIIEDAMEICRKVGTGYLWVDLYCVQQNDKVQKEQDIKDMGLIYQNALVTLVAGRAGTNTNNRLLPFDMDKAIHPRQLIEEIHGRKYITSLMPLFWQIAYSNWNDRGWTYQEGALSQRIAFFGGMDVSYQCGAGHWRESLHSGPYGHDARDLARSSGLELRSRSRYTLSTHDWLSNSQWNFGDYRAMLWTYSTRQLSYESDKINAISGCLNMLGQRKYVSFIWGLPSVDFHYALLWSGAYDRPRPGFPSWSWAGWHARQNFYQFAPKSGSSGGLVDDGTGRLVMTMAPTGSVFLLGGLDLKDMARSSRCSQTVCDLEVHGKAITIRSEVAHVHFEILNTSSGGQRHDPAPENGGKSKLSVESLEGDKMGDDLETPTASLLNRIGITCADGMVCRFERQYFPKVLRASTLASLQREGFNLVRILELRHLDGDEGTTPFHYVFCLGVNRDEADPEQGKRMGWYVLSAQEWTRASPKTVSIKIL